jgi:tetratricopeptide (TPR) repeat protein
LALIRRAHETASPDYDRQAAEAIATGLSLAPQDFQLRKAQVALLLDQHEFARARDEAKDLNLHNPDDATVHGYLARAYIGLGNYQDAEEAAQWMLNLLPFNVPGLLIAADLRDHYGDPEGALDLLRSRLRGNLTRRDRGAGLDREPDRIDRDRPGKVGCREPNAAACRRTFPRLS